MTAVADGGPCPGRSPHPRIPGRAPCPTSGWIGEFLVEKAEVLTDTDTGSGTDTGTANTSRAPGDASKANAAKSAAKSAMKKLPEVTLAFWVMKIAATTLGETAGDLFSQTLKLGYFLTTVALFLLFVVTLVVQLKSRRYNPFFYWTVILSTSMAGTTMSDFMNRDASAKYLSGGATSLGWGPQGLGLGYPAGAAILISILAVIFLAWKASGMTFQIRDITTFKGEALFWSAILVSNTLGTSMGDFLSDSSGLGYAGGALLVTGVIAVLVALMKAPAVPNVLLFWAAFVLTRPLGATAGDFLTKPVAKGGLDLGTAGSSAVLLAVLFGMMAYAQLRERRPAAVTP
ncbi:hypothetical protein [Streptomyces sp. NPDC058045]|uniref:COG4705 family protein n=1 Tax=Streptomyces sp. NPDC058045 TaxID=3346311 RepID=UPI0036EB748E